LQWDGATDVNSRRCRYGRGLLRRRCHRLIRRRAAGRRFHQPKAILIAALASKRSYDYANRGRYIDVAAPGVRIWTALPDNKEGMLNGTSFAAPFVTAIAAATYNSTPLRAQLSDGRLPLDPKGAMLAAFAIEKLSTGERSDQYGLGLVKAPSSCTPADQPVAATAKQPSAVAAPSRVDVSRAISLQ
jgi:subtilisin family serine protease